MSYISDTKSLRDLIILLDNKYNNKNIDNDKERDYYNNFDLDYLLDIKDKYDNLYFNSNHDIIDFILDNNNYSSVLCRIYFNINNRIFNELYAHDNLNINNINFINNPYESLLNAIKDNRNIIEKTNYKIIKYFNYLLKKHMNASKHFNKEYLSTLNNINKNISFIYDPIIDISSIKTEQYNQDYVVNMYLHELITKIMLILLTTPDEVFESDENYAKAIALQTVIRSILVIMNDNKKLIEYENFYNNFSKEETIGKSIIRAAFISNYYDVKDCMNGLVRRKIYGKSI